MAATTLGRELVREKLPDAYKKYADQTWDSKTVESVLTAIAKEDPDSYIDILHGLNDVGRRVVTTYGREAGISLEDFKKTAPVRHIQETLLNAFRTIYNDPNLTEEQKEEKILKLNSKFFQKAQDIIAEDHKTRNTALGSQVKAKVRGNPTQLMQLFLGNLSIEDASGRPVPFTFVEDYSSGVGPLSYWLGASSSRRGYKKVQFATADAGYLSKQIANVTHSTPVSSYDCGTKKSGIPVKATDPENLGAILLKDFKGFPAGSYVTKELMAKAGDDDEIIIRSPITCQAHGGICAKCAGIQATGQLPAVGEYLSLTAAKSFTEPFTQAAVGCLSPDTEVITENSVIKTLDQIKVGDKVIAYDRKSDVFYSCPVREVFDCGKKEIYDSVYELDGHCIHIKSTLDHRVLDAAGRVKPISKVESILIPKTEEVYTLKNRTLAGLIPAIDIEIDSEESLYQLANGIITHNSKHAGGVGAAKETDLPDGFEAISQMLTLPSTFKAKSVLATSHGKISSIKPAPQGGNYVYINDSKPIYVPSNRRITAKVGDEVDPGDVITDGIPNPKEITEYKGIGEGRAYFTKAFDKILREAGAGTMRRNVEAFTRAFVNKVTITDPSGYKGYLPGEVIDYDDALAQWKPRSTSKIMTPTNAIGKYLEEPVLDYTVGTPITKAVATKLNKYKMGDIRVDDNPPPFQSELIRSQAYMQNDKDWLARMTGERLQPALFDAARKGMEAPYESQSMYTRVMLSPYRKKQQ